MSRFSNIHVELQAARRAAVRAESAAIISGLVAFCVWIAALVLSGNSSALLVLSTVSVFALAFSLVAFCLASLSRSRAEQLRTKPHARRLS